MIGKICRVTTISNANITNTTLNSAFVHDRSLFIRFKTKKLPHFTFSTWKSNKTSSHFEFSQYTCKGTAHVQFIDIQNKSIS